MNRRDLRQDIGAVAVLLDHLLQAAHLAFDAAQAMKVAGLGFRIDAERFTTLAVVGAAAASNHLFQLFARFDCLGHWSSRYNQAGVKRRSRRLLPTTLTELNAIAAL